MHLNIAEFPHICQIPQARGNSPGFGSLTGNISNSSQRGMSELFGSRIDPVVESDFFGARKAVGCFEELEKEVNRLEKTQKTLAATGLVCPTTRRMSSVEENNPWRNLLLGGIALAHLPGDAREMLRAWHEGVNIFRTHKAPVYRGQHPMSLLNGTFAERLLKYNWIEKLDKPLYMTNFGKTIRDKLGIKLSNIDETQVVKGITTKSGRVLIPDRYPPFFKFEGTKFQQFMGDSLLRVSRLGVLTSALVEVPALVKSITETEGTILDKAKAFGIQLIKSTAFVGLITGGIILGGAALGGSLLAGTLIGGTAIGNLIGMGIGSAAAIIASNKLNKQIDKFFTDDSDCSDRYI